MIKYLLTELGRAGRDLEPWNLTPSQIFPVWPSHLVNKYTVSHFQPVKSSDSEQCLTFPQNIIA